MIEYLVSLISRHKVQGELQVLRQLELYREEFQEVGGSIWTDRLLYGFLLDDENLI